MVDRYIPEIRELQAWVTTYAQSSGEEFMHIGATLETCHVVTAKIISSVRSVLVLAAGSDDQSDLFGARQVLAKSLEDVSNSVDQYTAAFGDLKEARVALRQLEPLHICLSRTLELFEYIRLSYRINSASLDERSRADMEQLGVDMKALSATSAIAYETQTSRLHEAKLLLAQVVTNVSKKVIALASAKGQTESLITEIGAVQPEVSQLATHLVDHMTAIASNTVNLIVSLQADDAVRQRLEHVSEMLEEVAARIEQLRSANLKGNQDIQWFIYGACEIQERQVREIDAHITSSNEAIRFSLSRTVEQTKLLFREADQIANSSFVEANESRTRLHLNSATELLGKCFSEALTIDGDLQSKVTSAVELASQIGRISYQMKLLSLNVQIRSSLPGEMATIAVLSGHARLLADENSEVTLRVEQGLGRLSGIMDSFSALIAAVADNQRRVHHELETSSALFADALLETNDGVARDVQSISMQCSELSESTSNLLAGIGFATRARSGLDRITDLLERLMAQTVSSQERESEDAKVWLDVFKTKYTMEAERRLHSFAGTDLTNQTIDTPASSESDFGDNAELF